MNYNVAMPSLGADMEFGKLMEWKIAPGDEVKKGDIIATVETTKSTVEIESFRDGKVLKLIAGIGDKIPVGKTIALFEVDEKDKLLVSLDNSSIINTREAIASLMKKSKQEIPHYYLKHQICLDPLTLWLDELNAKLGPEKRIMVLTAILKAVILALKKFPQFNGHFIENKFIKKNIINLGIAIAPKTGNVLAPAILDADKLSLLDLNTHLIDLIRRTERGEIKNRELSDGTITITNVGDLGCDEVFGVIYPPQVCIIGIGKIHKAPLFLNGKLKEAFVSHFTLSADHRVSDGIEGARFLSSIEFFINEPQELEKSYE